MKIKIARGSPQSHHYLSKSWPLLLFMSVLFFITSCRDILGDDPELFKPQGYVRTFGTDAPIAGARVFQSECEGEVLGSLSCTVVDSALTDATGHFALGTPGGLTIAAAAAGYFPSETQAILGNGATPVDIKLYPHAWLRVTIRNESGAYLISAPGATPVSNSREFLLEAGRDTTFTIFGYGNDDFKYVFGVLDQPNHVLEDISTVKVNEGNIPVHKGEGALSFKVYLSGHDTTDLLIIY